MPGKAVGTAALQPDTDMTEGRRLTLLLVGDDQPRKSLFDRLRKECRFLPNLLLFEYIQRFGELRTAFFNFFFQYAHLRVLATQAQHSSARYIRMSDISRQ